MWKAISILPCVVGAACGGSDDDPGDGCGAPREVFFEWTLDDSLPADCGLRGDLPARAFVDADGNFVSDSTWPKSPLNSISMSP